ncbi:unnamed protein product [Heligmosomoides polygyrus]|uniref:BEN domain-containing protein n=1 Tax=Heligmosomoides polygyrus TaxID=6339 RepID=A0A3P8BYC6_HELPZ|nr:unnamed protein product [Heligmosomoides polygyrus]
MPSPTSLPNGVAAPSPPPPCSGCIKLHADIKQNMQQMMDKFDLIYMRLESLMNEKEKSRLIDVPSPADSRASPNTTQQGSRKRKPNKDTVHRVADDAPTLATAAVSEAPAVSATPSTPVSTTSSGFAESMGFLSSQIMDPLTQQQQLLQFIMQQSLGAAAAASGQQQQQHTSSAPPTSTPQSLPPSSTMTPSGQQQQQQQQQIKSEQQQPTDSSFMDQLHQQFKEIYQIGIWQVHGAIPERHQAFAFSVVLWWEVPGDPIARINGLIGRNLAAARLINFAATGVPADGVQRPAATRNCRIEGVSSSVSKVCDA